MWNPARSSQTRPSRTPSVHSVASVHSMSRSASMNSTRNSVNYDSDRSSDTAGDEDFIIQNAQFPQVPPMWQAARQDRMSQKLGALAQVTEIAPLRPRETPREVDAESSHSHETLAEQDHDYPEKTPTMLPKSLESEMEDAEPEEKPEPRVPGPLEQQLSALMYKLIYMEQENPTVAVTPEEYAELKDRVKTLEAEKATWAKRHEALFALRDEDVENNIKIRGMLAKERREHDAMKKLRDEDLANVLVLRSKLAEMTRKMDTTGKSAATSPARGRPRPGSILLERRDTTDLFTAAKSAALEQRTLELEKRNSDLLNQIASLKRNSGSISSTSIDNLNSMAAHKAWKGTVDDMEVKIKAKDAEIARLRAASGAGAASAASVAGMDWHRLEALHEQHATHREKSARQLQVLRSEKEMLMKDLHRREDENADLEARVEKLTRKLAAFA